MSDEMLAAIAKQKKESYNITNSGDPDVSVNVETPSEEQQPVKSTSKKKKPAIHGIKTLSSSDSNNNDANDINLSPTNGLNDALAKELNISQIDITDEDLRAGLPDVDDETFKEASVRIRTEIENYRRGLIVNYGFTFEEATKAAKNRAMKLAQDENNAYLEKHPKVGVVEINKKDVDKLEFTDEEREKLHKVKAIQLVVVEDAELKTIQVEKVDKKHKSSIIQTIDGCLSKYSVPVPITCDFATFKGAQIVQLLSIVKYNDEQLPEMIGKKASLLYDRFVGGTRLRKYAENGKVIMSYNDFINNFYFHDMEMGLFGVYIASSPEDVETNMQCSHCNNKFNWRYNLKQLIKADNIPETFKETMDNIIGKNYDEVYLNDMYNERHKATRLKSPLTNNIFNIAYPTIGRAINIYRSIDQTDEVMIYLASIALFVHDLYILNRSSGKYVHIEEDEYVELLEALQLLPQSDIDIIMKYVQDKVYKPEFVLKSKCPYCGNEMENELSIDDLVFLIAQDSSREIRI